MEDVDIGRLMQTTIHLTTAEVIIIVTMLEVDLCNKIPVTCSLAIVEFTILVLMIELELGLNRKATLPIAIFEQYFILKGDVYLGLRTASLPCAYQEVGVDCQVYYFLLVL